MVLTLRSPTNSSEETAALNFFLEACQGDWRRYLPTTPTPLTHTPNSHLGTWPETRRRSEFAFFLLTLGQLEPLLLQTSHLIFLSYQSPLQTQWCWLLTTPQKEGEEKHYRTQMIAGILRLCGFSVPEMGLLCQISPCL